MRPLAVLILVLSALAALFFALSSGSGRQQPSQHQVPEAAPRPQSLQEALLMPGEASNGVDPVKNPIVQVVGAGDSTGASSSFQGFITGQVIDTDNYSVGGASIKLIHIPVAALVLEGDLEILGDERASDPIAEVKSLANGSFAFDGVAPSERWGLVVSHENYSNHTVGPLMVPESGGLPNLQIVLVPGNTLFGRVTDKASGRPIPGAVISLTSPAATFMKADLRGPGNFEVISDEFGAYRFLNTNRAIKTLSIRAPGYATAIMNNFMAVPIEKIERKPITLRRNNPQPKPLDQGLTKVISREFDIQLEPGNSIAGRVLAPDGQGVRDVAIEAFCMTSGTGSHGNTVSQSGGEFLLQDLGEGQYTVSVRAKGYQCLPMQRIKAGETDLKIELIEQGSVSGRAIKDSTGRALSKFSCTVRTLSPGNVYWGQVVSTRNFADRSNGSFTINGIPAGDYVIEVRAQGLASSFSAPFKVEQGEQTRDISIRVTEGGTLRGQVIDNSSGKPLAGAKVKTNANNYLNSGLMLALSDSGRDATSKFEAQTAEDGTFEFKLMTPATYQISVEKTGFSSATMNDVKVGDGEETALQAIAMQAGALLEGYVLDADGSVVAGAYVILASKNRSDHWANRNTRTDGNGHYIMRNVSAGEYELSSSRPRGPGAGFLDGAVDMKKSSKQIVLQEGSINVFDLDFSEKKKR